ncbi:MAG TPA: carboxypeptidase-like regulatory domain-containing protein, partial [Acidimicrobiia bacterium]|nr:carboxypeptidase-like regulatory domain-containing protein [Acidimicrobiia bacterium]
LDMGRAAADPARDRLARSSTASAPTTIAQREAPTAVERTAVAAGARDTTLAARNDSASIAVRVRTVSGRPWASVSGCVHPLGATWYGLVSPTTFVTDGSGYAEVPVAPGRWIVRLSLDPEGYRKLDVAPGAAARLDYVVDPTLAVAGLVVDEARRPLRDVPISVTTLGTDSVRLDAARTDAEGRFRLAIVGNECVVVARAVGYATAFAHVQMPGARPDREARPTIVLQQANTLRGLVANQRGVPVGGCLVTAGSHAAQTDDELPPDAESAVSLADGTFLIERLAAGPHIVRARA